MFCICETETNKRKSVKKNYLTSLFYMYMYVPVERLNGKGALVYTHLF